MIFHDVFQIHVAEHGKYGDLPSNEGHEVKGSLENTNGLTRGGNFDSMIGQARAYLDGSNEWLVGVGYEIEGMFLVSNLYGLTRTYKIVSVAIGRRIVTDGSVHHIEVELERSDVEGS